MSKRCDLRRLVVFAVLSLGWMIVIFLFSAQNGDLSGDFSHGILASLLQFFRIDEGSLVAETLQLLHLWLRKSAHFCIYMVLAILLGNTFLSFSWKKRYQALATIGVAALYACSDELHQYFVPGRAAALRDVCIDTLGAVLGMVLVYVIPIVVKRCRSKIKTCMKKTD